MERFTDFRHYLSATLLLAVLAFSNQPAHAQTLIADTSGTTPTTGVAPLTVVLSGGSSVCVAPGYTCRWHWDYGDGTSSDPADDATGATWYRVPTRRHKP